MLAERRAHCYDGALFAAAALRRLGHPPLLVDLQAVRDDDHVLAVFRVRGHWGAVAKSNFAGLRFREPVFRTIRELAAELLRGLLQPAGARRPCGTTRCRSTSPASTSSTGPSATTTSGRSRSGSTDPATTACSPPAMERALGRVDARSIQAGMVGTDMAGVHAGSLSRSARAVLHAPALRGRDAIWGTTWIAITFQLGRAPPEASVALRFAIASALLFGWCRLRGIPLRFPPRVHAQLALLGLFMFCLSYLAVYRAETYLVSGLVALGYSASPLVNAAISRLAFGTPATRGVVVGGLLGVAGIALVFWPELRAGRRPTPGVVAGALLMAGAVLASGVGNVFATRLDRLGVNVWQKMAWGMAWGSAGSALVALATGEGLSLLLRPVLPGVAALPGRVRLDPGLRRLPDAPRAGGRGPGRLRRRDDAGGGARHLRVRWRASPGARRPCLGIAVVVAGNLVVLRVR